MKTNLKKWMLVVLMVACTTLLNATTYYTDASGAPNSVNNWWTNTNGTGSHPANFTNGDVFIIQNGDVMTTTASWTLSGAATLHVQNGGTLQADHAVDLDGTGTFIVDNGGRYIHNTSTALDLSIFNADDVVLTTVSSAGSIFEIRQTINLMIPPANASGQGDFGNLTITNNATVTFPSAIPASQYKVIGINDVLTITFGSTFDITNNAIGDNGTGSGFSTSNGSTAGGTFRTQRNGSPSLPSGANWHFTMEFYRASAQTIPAGTYTNINAAGGARTIGSGSTVTISGTFTPGSGTYTTTGSTVEFNGSSSQTVPALTSSNYNNLTISNSAAVKSAGADINVNGQLTVSSGAIFDLVTFNLGITASSISGTGTIRTQSLSSSPLPNGKTWSPSVEYNSSGGNQKVAAGTYTATLTLSHSSGSTKSDAQGAIDATSLTIGTNSILDMQTNALSGLGGTVSVTGELRTQNTGSALPSAKTWQGTVVYNSSSPQTIIQGTYTNLTASGGLRTLDAGIVNISGTFTPGSGTYTTTTNTVVFNGSGSQSIPAITPAYNNLTVSNTGTKSLSGNVDVAGTLSLSTSSDFLAINGNTLTLNGSTSLTGSLKGSSTSNLIVSGSGGGSPTIKFNAAATDSLINTITLNRTGAGAGLALGSSLAITNLLSVTNGAFDLSGNRVTLKSTSITNTAQVGPVGGSIAYTGGGQFTVERFIPSGNRAYRDIAPGVSTSASFFNSWQEAGSAPSNFGTHVTGLAGSSPGGVDATTGLDITGSGAKSLFTCISGSWNTGVANTKTTTPNVYQAYRTLIRGDRNVNLYQSPTPATMNGATALRTTGQLVTGSVTYNTSGATNNSVLDAGNPMNNTVNGFSLLGNPYVAAIDWNGLAKTNIAGTYWVFDPTISTAGAYVTYDGVTNSNLSSNVNQYIQPGQGFFVQTSSASPQLVIAESNKSALGSSLTGVFRNQDGNSVNKLSISLTKFVSGRGNLNMDGAVAVFNAGSNNDVDANDADKMTNNADNIAIYRSSKRISIEHRKLPTANDTIPLRIWLPTNGASYSLTIDSRNFSSGISTYVIDKFNSTETLLKTNDTTNIPFTVNTADTATHINRFFIVFRGSAVPLNSINVKASVKGSGVQVDWNTTNETQLANYEVEKSTNGISFSKIGSVVANNGLANNYSLFDAVPQKGNNYYRIKIVNKDNSSSYSKTILLNLGDMKGDVVIYPNPLKGNNLSLQLNNMVKGNYALQIFSSGGQTVFSQAFVHDGGTATQTVDLRSNRLSVGNYVVVVTLPNGNKINKPIFIEE